MRTPKWDWRSALTSDERAQIERQDGEIKFHRGELSAIQHIRKHIVNRAIQRVKYSARDR